MIPRALKIVFQNKAYALLAGLVALFIFALAVWLPNLRLLFSLEFDRAVPVGDKLTFPLRLAESITTNFTPLSASYTVAIAILFGINLAMTIYYFKKRQETLTQTGTATTFVGFVSGMFGVGCAACGSVILSAMGAGGALTLLPLHGGEFGITGVLLLIVSISLVAKKIVRPSACEIQHSRNR